MAEIRDADARFAEGVRLFDAGDYEGAIKEFSAVITVDPNRKQAYLYRTKAYQTHDRERAKEVTPPEIQGDGSFWGGFLWIFIPIIALSALSTLGVSFERFYWLWYISVGVFAVGIIATLITLRFDKVLTTKGMAIAVIIGLVTLAATCGVNVATCLKYCDFSGLAPPGGYD